jgi:hypothetical protein
MIRRYNLSHPVGQPMPEDWLDLPDSVVAAADYDALVARLAATDRLLLVARDCLRTAHNGWAKTLGREIDAFLRPAVVVDDPIIDAQHGETGRMWRGPRSQLPRRYAEVSIPACNHFPGQSTCEWCSAPAAQPCGHPWKAQHDFKCILCSSPVSAVQPERCCVDYPRCDCNSPPEPDADLLAFGYAPGNYESFCLTCEQRMTGVDKRCHCCRPCAKEKWGAAEKARLMGLRAPTEWPTRALTQQAKECGCGICDACVAVSRAIEHRN